MKKEEQIEYIREFLQRKYGLNLEAWVSFDDLLVTGYTLNENAEVLTRHLRQLIDEYPEEFADRLTPSAFEELKLNLATEDFQESLKQAEES